MSQANNSNLHFIDNLKVILIFLVVFGHLIERYIESNSTLMGIYMFIYSFHMPLFIFISGFLSKNISKSRKIFLNNLLVPYIILNIIWYTLAYLYTGTTNLPILYPGWTLWFLLSLFFWRVTLRYIIKIRYIIPISFILGILVGLVSNGDMLSFSRTIVFLPFFLIGYYCDMTHLHKISNRVYINRKWSITCLILFLILALYMSENNILDYRFFYGSYSYYELEINIFKGVVLRILLYCASIFISIFICKIIPTGKTFYTDASKSTMYVYSFHIYIVILIFYLIPTWDKNIITNWIILISPLCITYILSRKLFEKIYNILFSPFYKLVHLII